MQQELSSLPAGADKQQNTDQLDRVGLDALATFEQIRADRQDEITLRLGAYSPLGFSDDQPERWEVFAEGARRADFIAALPEADEIEDYPGNIGFEEHCRRMLEIARETGKMLHVHTDQRNEPGENGTERRMANPRSGRCT